MHNSSEGRGSGWQSTAMWGANRGSVEQNPRVSDWNLLILSAWPEPVHQRSLARTLVSQSYISDGPINNLTYFGSFFKWNVVQTSIEVTERHTVVHVQIWQVKNIKSVILPSWKWNDFCVVCPEPLCLWNLRQLVGPPDRAPLLSFEWWLTSLL